MQFLFDRLPLLLLIDCVATQLIGGGVVVFLPCQQKILRDMMDLLDSILGSMDKPPSLSDKEKEKAKSKIFVFENFCLVCPASLAIAVFNLKKCLPILEIKEARNKEEEAMRRWQNSFKKEVNDSGSMMVVGC